MILSFVISVLALSQCRSSLCNGGRCALGPGNQVHCECLEGMTGPRCEESECEITQF